MRIFILLTLIFSVTSQASNAITLDDVQVHAQKNPSLSKPNYQYISREEIEGKYSQLSDFLSTVNGLQIQQMSGLGSPALVSIRGASAQQTRVYINGIESSDAQFGGYDLNILPINQIESIEIVQDSNDRAIGGSIYITTRTSSSNQITLQAGSYDTYIANLTLALAPNWSLQAEHQQSKNDYWYPVPSPALDSQNQFHTEKLNNADFQRNSMQLSGGNDYLSTRIRAVEQKKNIENFSRNYPDNNSNLSENSILAELYGKINLLSMQQKWLAGHSIRKENFLDLHGYVGLGKDDNHYQYEKSYLNFENLITLGNWQHNIDFKLSQESFASQYKLSKGNCNGITVCDTLSNQDSSTIGTSITWESDEKNHSINLAAYQQNTHNKSKPKTGNRNPSSESESFKGFNIGYQWYLPAIEFGLNYKKAARIPTLYERYGDHGLMLNNVNLKTEISETLSFDSLLNSSENFKLSLSFFKRDLINAIVPIYDARGIGRYENTSKATLIGTEFNSNAYLGIFYIKLNGALYDSLTYSDVKSFNNKKLAGTYHKTIKSFIGLSNNDHQLEFGYEWNDEIYIDRSNLIIGEKRYLYNASYQYQYKNNSFGLNIKNLANNKFKDFTNRPTIGREWILFFNKNF